MKRKHIKSIKASNLILQKGNLWHCFLSLLRENLRYLTNETNEREFGKFIHKITNDSTKHVDDKFFFISFSFALPKFATLETFIFLKALSFVFSHLTSSQAHSKIEFL